METVVAIRHPFFCITSVSFDIFGRRFRKNPAVHDDDVVEDRHYLVGTMAQSKILDTFLMFRDSDTRSNSELRGDLSAPALSYRTKELERLGLIASEGSYRNLMWSITPKGKQVLRRL